MADALCKFIVDEFGTGELLRRLADPVYFQALSNVLGYDWDSSGSTTVTCGVLRSALDFDTHGVVAAGGKGLASQKTPEQLMSLTDYGLDGQRLAELSRRVAKVDSTAIQDGYQLYQHTFFVDGEENWTVVQQGMDGTSGDARRYHWSSEDVDSLIDEPHSGIISGDVKTVALDLTARQSEGCRDATLDLIGDGPRRVVRLYEDIRPYGESTLLDWIDGEGRRIILPGHKVFPTRMDWNAVRRAYETSPSDYEGLLFLKGMGPATIRGLSLIAEIVYGTEASWSDPVRMTFAFGGKDGVPYPVDRKAYDGAIQFMEQAVEEARLGRRERVLALRRLRKFAPPIIRSTVPMADRLSRSPKDSC